MITISIDNIIMILIMISIGMYGSYYLIKIFSEIKKTHKEKIDEWERDRDRLKKEAEEWDEEWNRKNRELREKIERFQREINERHRMRAEEYNRQYQRAAERAVAYAQALQKSMKVLEIKHHPFTLEELSQQRRKLSLKYHPDVNGGSDKKMKEINEAFDLLKNHAEK